MPSQCRLKIKSLSTVRAGIGGTGECGGQRLAFRIQLPYALAFQSSRVLSDPPSSPSTSTYGARPGEPSSARWPFFASPRIRRTDMRRSVFGFGTASRIQQRSGGTFSSWSPLTGESPASSEAGGNNGNRNDSCQAPFGVGDLAVQKIPQFAVGVMAQKNGGCIKTRHTLSGRQYTAGQEGPNRICI